MAVAILAHKQGATVPCLRVHEHSCKTVWPGLSGTATLISCMVSSSEDNFLEDNLM